MVPPGQTIHFQRIELGRDYGDRLEVSAGLELGQRVVVNPGDTVREGVKVKTVVVNEKPAPIASPAGAARK
jgi:multidrug efflux pump subunit AcrA (membrane-fusion protein)